MNSAKIDKKWNTGGLLKRAWRLQESTTTQCHKIFSFCSSFHDFERDTWRKDHTIKNNSTGNEYILTSLSRRFSLFARHAIMGCSVYRVNLHTNYSVVDTRVLNACLFLIT